MAGQNDPKNAVLARGRRAADPPAFRRRYAGGPPGRSAGGPPAVRRRSARDPHRCRTGPAPVPHRSRTGPAPVPHRPRRRSAANPHGYLQTARKAKKNWVFSSVFFGVFVLLGMFLCFVWGVFVRRRRAAHLFRPSARDPHCSPHLLRTCAALVPHLCRTCAALVPNLCRTCAALVPHLCRTCAALVPHLCRTSDRCKLEVMAFYPPN